MAIQEFLLTLIPFDNILSLDWEIKGPAIFIIGWFLVRSLSCLFKFKFIQAATNLLNAFVLTVILSRAGHVIQELIFGAPPAS